MILYMLSNFLTKKQKVVLINSNKNQQKGIALVPVLIIATFASIIGTMLLSQAETSSTDAFDHLRRRQAFYAIDGMGRIIVKEVQNYMVTNPDPSTSDLQNTQNISIPNIAGYVMDTYNVASTGTAFDGPIVNGPFEGMQAHQKPILIELKAHQSGTSTTSEVRLRVTLGQISMFQFLAFGDGYTDVFPGQNMTVNPGRIHANGDLCFASSATFSIEYITAANRILAGDSRCRRTAGTSARVWDGSIYTTISSSNDNGCTNCAGSGKSWRAYALATWKNHVKDGTHGVPYLRLPITGTTKVQSGKNAAGAAVSNATNVRLLIDPVLSTDSQDILDQKFAWQADIRIINGVWYKNNGSWPGLPIWSDHPGSFVTKNEEGIEGTTAQSVGQSDLQISRAWTNVPKRFSYYEYDTTAKNLYNNDSGVISYGNLIQVSSSWLPGYWSAGGNGTSSSDISGYTKKNFCYWCGNKPCSITSTTSTTYAPVSIRQASTPFCQYLVGSTYYSIKEAQYLQGTTGGFVDNRVNYSNGNKFKILPTNFDLAQFATAMQDTTPGELGSYFSGGATFNGIIYITNTWSGSMSGLPNGPATLWPDQGGLLDNAQTGNNGFSTRAQRSLPYQLCSESLGYKTGLGAQRIAFAGRASDNITTSSNEFEPSYTIPSCTYSLNQTSRSNAIRIHNGASISKTLFPEGLSIVSNIPVYVLGDFNTSAITTSSTSQPWIPVMIGADSLTLLSNAWSDVNANWTNPAYTTRPASNTTYNFEFLGGTVETVNSSQYSGGIENFPRFLENWTSKTATITGSFVLGFSSVYQNQPWRYGTPIYDAPVRTWSFDPHLATLTNQPPGAPMFSVYAVSRLNRS